jgi:hypothetical protein
MTPFKTMGVGLLCVLLALASVGSARAHGLEENRATFVLRDQNHVSVTLFITFSEALHRALAPDRSFQDFVMAHAAMSPEAFKAALLKAQGTFQAQTSIETAGGHRLLLERWRWPEPAAVQQVLRERAMQALAAPNEHPFETALEVRAELQAAKAVASLRVSFPPAFQRVLVVSYQPKQVWVEPQQASPEIKF